MAGKGRRKRKWGKRTRGKRRALLSRSSRNRGLLRPGGARRGLETAPRYLYSAPSADPARCLEGRGEGNGDRRREGGEGEEEEEDEEEDEGQEASSSWQIIAQSRSAQARWCEKGGGNGSTVFV